MEEGKRKQRDDAGVTSGKRMKPPRDRPSDVWTITSLDATTEAEVEEFYAILRRIHVAVTYFENGSGKRSKLRTQPFELEDGVVKVNGEGGGQREDVEKCLGFDLNADPVEEPDSV